MEESWWKNIIPGTELLRCLRRWLSDKQERDRSQFCKIKILINPERVLSI
jgi:hypothetical protein